ncbi:hypothetical protein BpHYR1_025622 [Brachionus plicatilis]|uniref:Uncharacterized protein n=1 Tax=Brachionus plicatilis TaxID=10195 RepID=A0A3M7STR7_BRAPC|nr:hypothetical protein BpHYR1_025622 [Brachionus plicatilis]
MRSSGHGRASESDESAESLAYSWSSSSSSDLALRLGFWVRGRRVSLNNCSFSVCSSASIWCRSDSGIMSVQDLSSSVVEKVATLNWERSSSPALGSLASSRVSARFSISSMS